MGVNARRGGGRGPAGGPRTWGQGRVKPLENQRGKKVVWGWLKRLVRVRGESRPHRSVARAAPSPLAGLGACILSRPLLSSFRLVMPGAGLVLEDILLARLLVVNTF